MNCLICRRQLLIAPRDLSIEQRAHIASCDGCARLREAVADVDRRVIDAELVPVPDGLAHRVLPARRRGFVWQRTGVAGLALAAS